MATHRILVLDDDMDTCLNLRDVLQVMGDYQVDIAPDGASALDLMNAGHSYGAAIFDLKLPKLDGIQVYEAAMRSGSAVPTILVSAYTNSDTQKRAYDAGLFRVISKPVSMDQLLLSLIAAIETADKN